MCVQKFLPHGITTICHISSVAARGEKRIKSVKKTDHVGREEGREIEVDSSFLCPSFIVVPFPPSVFVPSI